MELPRDPPHRIVGPAVEKATCGCDAICNELEICSEKRGEMIFMVCRKLQELGTEKAAVERPREDPDHSRQAEVAGKEVLRVEENP